MQGDLPARAKRGEVGRGRAIERSNSELSDHRTQSGLLARLKRDHPHLAQQVIDGELSARASTSQQPQETVLASRADTTNLTIHLLGNIPPQPLQTHRRQTKAIRTLTNLTKQRGVRLPTLQRFTRSSADEKIISDLLNTPQTLPLNRLRHLPQCSPPRRCAALQRPRRSLPGPALKRKCHTPKILTLIPSTMRIRNRPRHTSSLQSIHQENYPQNNPQNTLLTAPSQPTTPNPQTCSQRWKLCFPRRLLGWGGVHGRVVLEWKAPLGRGGVGVLGATLPLPSLLPTCWGCVVWVSCSGWCGLLRFVLIRF